MKVTIIVLVLLLFALQYRLWVGEGSIAHVTRLSQQIAEQSEENRLLSLKNKRLAAEVEALRNGLDAVEAKAREDLGMVKEGETFFLFVEEKNAP